MEFKIEPVRVEGVKIVVDEEGRLLGRAYLYVMKNDLHSRPFGLLEDVFVAEESRGSGIGSMLVEKVCAEAKRLGCYKLIATSRFSRPRVHELYERLGFERHGLEFRRDFE